MARKKDLASLKPDSAKMQAFSPEVKGAKAGDLAETAPLTCTCLCKCFGYFKFDEWPNLDSTTVPLELPPFEEGDIKILYRDKIKVFYKTLKQANEAGYTHFEEVKKEKQKEGCIYSFTGLRGDAKQLYYDVNSGKEKRISFVQAKTPA